MVCFPNRSDRWWWSYLLVCTFVPRASTFRLFAAEGYKHVTASSLIPLNSSHRAESNELSPGSGAPMAGELSPFGTLLTATGRPPPRALYHSIHLVRRILIVRSPALADPRLMSYHSFSPADSYRHATASSLIPFDSSRPADSNGVLPNSIRRLAVELSSTLYLCSPGRYLQIVTCRVLQACHSFEPYTIEFQSSS